MKIIITENQYKKLKESLEDANLAKEEKVKNAKNNVKNIASQVNSMGLGADVTDFMVRVAAVETCYGLATNNVDIWQIDPIAFKDTKDTKSHPSLKKKLEKIKTQKNIDWKSLSQSEMESSSLKNAIAARLVLSNIPSSVPSDLEGQAKYWKDNYNTSAGGGTVNDFIRKSSNLKACIGYVK
jgi:hypothetical protein